MEGDFVPQRIVENSEDRQYAYENERMLNPKQKLVYTDVLRRVLSNTGGVIFLDAPGGTGKTFVNKLLIAKLASLSKAVIAVASTGIAASLMPGGKTAHSAFKIPLSIDQVESPICNITINSPQGQVLKSAKLIIWDECSMSHKKALEALDRTLKDFCGNSRLMGGKVVLLTGDFRQTLPVIRHGLMADTINACLKSSPLWRDVRTKKLTVNMRSQNANNAAAFEFSRDLLKIGNGTFPTNEEGLCDIRCIAN